MTTVDTSSSGLAAVMWNVRIKILGVKSRLDSPSKLPKCSSSFKLSSISQYRLLHCDFTMTTFQSRLNEKWAVYCVLSNVYDTLYSYSYSTLNKIGLWGKFLLKAIDIINLHSTLVTLRYKMEKQQTADEDIN